jgi:beta-N-acetylhexosaminidase
MTLADRSALTGLIDPSRDPRAVLGLVMLSFDGRSVPASVRERMASAPAAGVTLYRGRNAAAPDAVRALTDDLVAAAGGPLLIAADQEGGQLIGLGDQTTPFPGSMALGATGDADLAERVGRATGRELRALGVNVNYAPVCDVASNPENPSLGIRAFGDNPGRVGMLAAAFVRGLQGQGVAGTAKHFPGKGMAAADPHHELPRLDLDLQRLDAVELVPFRAAIDAGIRMVMVGHYALPALTGRPDLPTSLSERVVRGLLRRGLGFDGVIITDALNMRALRQGPEQANDAATAVQAGVDLLLCTPDSTRQDDLHGALSAAALQGVFDPAGMGESKRRVGALRAWIGEFEQPPLEVVGCAEHQALAHEVAAGAVTLVRDGIGLLPLPMASDATIAAIMPRPKDLTPADTSSTVAPGLAAALRAHHPRVEELVTGHPPSPDEIAAIRDGMRSFDLCVVGTLDAARDPAQAGLVQALVTSGVPTVWVALRGPFDLAAVPSAPVFACTYGILPPSLQALADALFGRAPFRGRLPAGIPDLYPTGHGVLR